MDSLTISTSENLGKIKYESGSKWTVLSPKLDYHLQQNGRSWAIVDDVLSQSGRLRSIKVIT